MAQNCPVEGSGGAVLALQGELTIERAEEVKQAFLHALAHAPSLTLDLDQAARVDIAFLQLIKAAELAFAARGKGFGIKPCLPDRILAYLTGTGFCALLVRCPGHDACPPNCRQRTDI